MSGNINNLLICNVERLLIFISKERLESLTNYSNVDKLFLLHNGISLGHIAIVINIIFGVYYYLKQKSDHKNWSWIIFIFGVHECRK